MEAAAADAASGGRGGRRAGADEAEAESPRTTSTEARRRRRRCAETEAADEAVPRRLPPTRRRSRPRPDPWPSGRPSRAPPDEPIRAPTDARPDRARPTPSGIVGRPPPARTGPGASSRSWSCRPSSWRSSSRRFLVQAFFIPSPSMEPTLKPGDRILVCRVCLHFQDIHRGDVLVFSDPHPPAGAGRGLIGGLPALARARAWAWRSPRTPTSSSGWGRCRARRGRSVAASLYVDGQKIDRPFLSPNIDTRSFGPQTVPMACCSCWATTRCESGDSRLSPARGRAGLRADRQGDREGVRHRVAARRGWGGSTDAAGPGPLRAPRLRAQGFARVAGVDEAGRGALAGPMVAAAVILPEGFDLEGIRDSKQLSHATSARRRSAGSRPARWWRCAR